MPGVTTRSNVGRAGALYRAFARGDIGSLLGGLTEDVTWLAAEGLPHGRTFIGPESVADHVPAPLAEEWDELHVVTGRFLGDGDTVVVTGRYRGTYAATGDHVDVPFAHVPTMHDGGVARFEECTDAHLRRGAF